MPKPEPYPDYAPQVLPEASGVAGFERLEMPDDPTPAQRRAVEQAQHKAQRARQLVINTFSNPPGKELLHNVWVPFLIEQPSLARGVDPLEAALIEGRKNFIRDILQILKSESSDG